MQIEMGQIESIPEGEARSFRLNAEHQVLAVKKSGKVYFYLNRCPHLHVPLNWEPDRFLNPGGDLIQCSTHGAQFSIETGECLQGPCRGEYLERLDYEENNGILYLNTSCLSVV